MSDSWPGPAVFAAIALLVVAVTFRIALALVKRVLRTDIAECEGKVWGGIGAGGEYSLTAKAQGREVSQRKDL